jgi:hypothetical protein
MGSDGFYCPVPENCPKSRAQWDGDDPPFETERGVLGHLSSLSGDEAHDDARQNEAWKGADSPDGEPNEGGDEWDPDGDSADSPSPDSTDDDDMSTDDDYQRQQANRGGDGGDDSPDDDPADGGDDGGSSGPPATTDEGDLWSLLDGPLLVYGLAICLLALGVLVVLRRRSDDTDSSADGSDEPANDRDSATDSDDEDDDSAPSREEVTLIDG